MKKLAYVGLVIGMLQIALVVGAHGVREDWDGNSSDRWKEREEIDKSFDLGSGAKIEVSGINGWVVIDNTAGNAARVKVTRYGKTRAALDARQFTTELRGNVLVIKGEKNDRNSRGSGDGVREEVTLSIPRSVSMDVSGVNGHVTVAEIDGPITISGINGQVKVAKAGSASNISGVNGSVTVALRELSNEGMDISGINGQVSLSFDSGISADLSVSGINGRVITDGTPLTLQGKVTPSSFKARLGNGGATISVSGINGNVKINQNSGER